MRIVTLVAALFLFLVLPQAASACVPAPTANPRTPTAAPKPTETAAQATRRQAEEARTAFGAADIVFRGQVTRTERFVDNTYAYYTDVYALRATFAVDAVWKGTVGSPMTVVSRRPYVTDCDLTNGQTGPPYLLDEQATYLVYAKINAATQTYDISRLTESAAIAADVTVIGPGTRGVAAATLALPTAVPTATLVPANSRVFPTPVLWTPVASPATRSTTVSSVATSTALSQLRDIVVIPSPAATAATAAPALPKPSRDRMAVLLALGGGWVIVAAFAGIIVARRVRRSSPPSRSG